MMCGCDSYHGELCELKGQCKYYIQKSCICNQRLAVCNRVVRDWPQPTKEGLDAVRIVVLAMAQAMGNIGALETPDWIQTYASRKRLQYEHAYRSLLVRPVRRQDATVQAFVKREKVSDPTKDPRLIQSRSRRFGISIGMYLKPIEKKFYKLHGTHIRYLPNGRLMAKGCTQQQRAALVHAAWNALENPVQLALDCSRFDAHCSRKLLLLEHLFYRKCNRSNKFATLLQWQLDNVGYTTDGIRYTCSGRRMSGDMNTSVGNCVLMIAMLSAAMHEMRIPKAHWRMVDDGDDCCLIVEQRHEALITAQITDIFATYGHELKIESTSTTIETVRLCSCSPITVVNTPTMVQEPSRCIGKARVHLRPYTGRHLTKYTATVGQCLLSINVGVPILQALACLLRRSDKDIYPDIPGTFLYSVQPDFKLAQPIQVDIRSRISFANAFRISLEDQIHIEQSYNHITAKQLLRTALPTWPEAPDGRW
nr:MAG: RNA-dependent RNA polymerase [Riboviria sp.]